MRIAICENNAAGATQLCGWIEQYCKLYRIPADLKCFLSPMAFSSHEGHFNKPVYHNGQIVLLLVDFPKEKIYILIFHEAEGTTELLEA